jgi:hypothetical protein
MQCTDVLVYNGNITLDSDCHVSNNTVGDIYGFGQVYILFYVRIYLILSLLLGGLYKVQERNDWHGSMPVCSFFCDLVLVSKLFVRFA